LSINLLERVHKPWYLQICIKSRADALANLPNPARWYPVREMWPTTWQLKGPKPIKRPSSSVEPKEAF
jgi:hypothetical protein